MCNYYHLFIKGYTSIAAPLTDLFQLNPTQFVFANSGNAALVALKLLFNSILFFGIFNPNLPSHVLVDTLDFASGTILEQSYLSGWHPVEYFFKHLSPIEANYPATEIEHLGCLHAMQHW